MGSEPVIDFVYPRQRQLELKGLLREQILEPGARAAQHLRMHPAGQRADIAPVEIGEAVFPGIGSEPGTLLLPVAPVPRERHVARVGEAPVGELLRLLESEYQALDHPGI